MVMTLVVVELGLAEFVGDHLFHALVSARLEATHSDYSSDAGKEYHAEDYLKRPTWSIEGRPRNRAANHS
jgi:hypothetical protein